MRLQNLGYAITAHRAQGSTVDTAHAIVHSPEMTRESLYVSMTREREANHVYVATDEHHLEPHQHRTDLEMTARSILYGILQHAGAELSAHDTIAAEQDAWGSLAQLAAEYETIAQEAQQERWITLLEHGGLTPPQIDELVDSDSFGPLTVVLRRLEADGHDIDDLLPRVTQAGNLDHAADLGSLLRYRIQRVTATYQPQHRRAPGRIAGLVPRATGTMTPDMTQALAEREQLMEQRLTALVAAVRTSPEPWMRSLNADGEPVAEEALVAVLAYRDRWGITASSPLGIVPDDDAQRIDYERTHTILGSSTRDEDDAATRRGPGRAGPSRG
ncbi:C-terminal helicase domain-containing protein [Pseudoclavibacter sp. CFCC 11306]|uniref:C-terminal helicase domain-containing protein n=1 Tax=Pseudoclavibacter sp. CFCC 11306 TaxID=1564493 RepID=UPI001787E698|nr:helicase C-terminal domain-containing protein [Pseudoclavibacter sp. CFCC 11306]